MDSLMQYTISGALIAQLIEWLKFKGWFPVDYDQKQLLRATNVLFAVVMVVGMRLVSDQLCYDSIECLRSFATDVAGVMGSQIVIYTGLIKKSDEEKQTLHQIMMDT